MIDCTERDGFIILTSHWFELRFERTTGRWHEFLDGSGATILQPGRDQAPVLLTVNGITTATRGRAQVDSIIDADVVGIQTRCTGWNLDHDETGATLTINTVDGEWQIDQIFKVAADEPLIERGLSLVYRGKETVLLRDVALRVPPAVFGSPGDNCVHAPGYPTQTCVPLNELPLGEDWDRTVGKPFGVGWEPGVFGIEHNAEDQALAIWCYDEVEPVHLRVRRVDHGVQVRHLVLLADRCPQGHTVHWHGQYVRLHSESWMAALQAYQAWYEHVDLRAPSEPAWAKEARIYEVFIGEQPIGSGSRRSRYQSMDDLIADLDRIQDLGFNVIQLMPHMPFPAYAIYDYYDVDVHYGSAEGLKRLVTVAHGLGVRVLLDVIVHGVLDREALRTLNATINHGFADADRLFERHPYRKEHPEWSVENEFGAMAATYTWAFDHANEEWRTFMIDCFVHYVREYDVDGFRVDALIWNLFPNWAEDLPYLASASMFGSRALSERIRAAVHAVKPDVILYTETSIPIFARAYDLIYNYDLQGLFSALVRPISIRGFAYTFAKPLARIRAADLGDWLLQRRLVLPKGVTTVHHLDSHDSHEWGELMQYRREAFGEEAARALFALCCCLDGAIMVFSGAEDGEESYYRQWLHFKRDLLALAVGTCDPLAVKVDNTDVVALLRTHHSQAVVALIHLADVPAHAVLTLPADIAMASPGPYRVVDLVSKETIGTINFEGLHVKLQMSFGPFQTRLLAFERVDAQSHNTRK